MQTDLVHSPSLRAGIYFQHADLMAAGDGRSTDATALLMLAAVHGAAGHQFERLQPLVDVLQAARGAAGSIDVNRLVRVAGDTGSSAAIQTALDLTAELFNEPLARAFADAFRAAPWRGLRRWLVSPSVVLKSQSRHGGRGSWRRRALREIIRKIGRPDNAAVAERRSGRPSDLTEATASPIRLSGARETLSSNALNRSTNPTTCFGSYLPASNRTAQFSASFSRSSRVSNTNGGATRLRSGRHVIWMSPHRIVGCVHVLLRIARACGIFILQARISRWIRS